MEIAGYSQWQITRSSEESLFIKGLKGRDKINRDAEVGQSEEARKAFSCSCI